MSKPRHAAMDNQIKFKFPYTKLRYTAIEQKLDQMAASEFISDAAIRFKLGRAPPSESLTDSNSAAQVFGHQPSEPDFLAVVALARCYCRYAALRHAKALLAAKDAIFAARRAVAQRKRHSFVPCAHSR
ncbi:hypothetical protein PCASD_21524 [Puccinia coronata f. sp. avenae]|uniref:Uncharacterized protein n=1 Tax=Puccinia coronata f. sp. avenae TaxID=200324 RepID=A0A2N5TTC2_9BASI|nr:hypothetical protein PCASD_21524 [Puccinia coronata f. sp. avenae]